jgi:lipoprotein-releasing system ATP-binding protein
MNDLAESKPAKASSTPSDDAPVLEARGLGKTFRQGPLEVEVLRGVDLASAAAERIAIVGSPAPARARCCTAWAGWSAERPGRCSGRAGPDALGERARGRCATAARLRLPVPSPAAGVHGAGERGDAATDRQPPRPRPASAPRMLERVGLGHRRAPQALGTLRRRAPARGHRAGAGDAPGLRAGGRAHRQPGPHTAAGVYELMLELNEEQGTSFVIVTHDLELAGAYRSDLAAWTTACWRDGRGIAGVCGADLAHQAPAPQACTAK